MLQSAKWQEKSMPSNSNPPVRDWGLYSLIVGFMALFVAGIGLQTNGSHSAISVRRFVPACPWIPPLQDQTEFQTLILRKLQTYYLSRSHFLIAELRDRKNLAELKSFDLRVIVTARRLPLVWTHCVSHFRRGRATRAEQATETEKTRRYVAEEIAKANEREAVNAIRIDHLNEQVMPSQDPPPEN